MSQIKNYKIEERTEEDVKKHGGIEKAILFLESELSSFYNMWGMWSSDCLGHAIECTKLKISFLKKKLNGKTT
jgi:hypothetical protein